jgi:hypothetical protein
MYAAMLMLLSRGIRTKSQFEAVLLEGSCGGVARVTFCSGTDGGMIRADRWKAILLMGWS